MLCTTPKPQAYPAVLASGGDDPNRPRTCARGAGHCGRPWTMGETRSIAFGLQYETFHEVSPQCTPLSEWRRMAMHADEAPGIAIHGASVSLEIDARLEMIKRYAEIRTPCSSAPLKNLAGRSVRPTVGAALRAPGISPMKMTCN